MDEEEPQEVLDYLSIKWHPKNPSFWANMKKYSHLGVLDPVKFPKDTIMGRTTHNNPTCKGLIGIYLGKLPNFAGNYSFMAAAAAAVASSGAENV